MGIDYFVRNHLVKNNKVDRKISGWWFRKVIPTGNVVINFDEFCFCYFRQYIIRQSDSLKVYILSIELNLDIVAVKQRLAMLHSSQAKISYIKKFINSVEKTTWDWSK